MVKPHKTSKACPDCRGRLVMFSRLNESNGDYWCESCREKFGREMETQLPKWTDEIGFMRRKDVREMKAYVSKYAIKKGGIQLDKDIEKIKKYIRKVLIDDYE